MPTPEQLDVLAAQAIDSAPPATLSLTDINRRAKQRRRRTVALRTSATMVAVVVAIAVGWSLQGNHTERTQVAAPQQADRLGVVLDDAGIWPSGDGAPSPTAIAENFAAGVLRWNNARVTIDPSRTGDPTWITIQNPDTGTQLRALSVPAGDIDHWRFIQIGSGLTMGPGDTGPRVGFGTRRPGVDRVEVYASTNTGTSSFQGPVDDTTNSIELTGIRDLNEVRSVLVIYIDANGHVLDAAGTATYIDQPTTIPDRVPPDVPTG